MDFALEANASAVRDVAADVFARHQPEWAERFSGSVDHDRPLWQAIGAAGLLSLPLPAAVDGDDLDIAAILPLLRAMGETAAVTPALVTLAAGVAAQSAPEASRRSLAEIVAGGGWIAVALGEPGDALTATPHVTVRDGMLNGTKSAVLHADGAEVLLVTTAAGVIAVPRSADGVHIRRTPSSSGWGEYTVSFDDTPVADDAVTGLDAGVLRDVYRLSLAAYADGLVAGATKLTAEHVSGREQFGKPIALFQAVGQQLADIYVVARAMNLATTAAAWGMSTGRDAARDLDIGGYWMAEELPATMRTMTHLHGGVGVDITYPLHRYFSLTKDLARLVGGAVPRLDELAETTSGAQTTARMGAVGVH